MEEVKQICINSPEQVFTLVTYAIAAVSAIVNFVPAPDKAKTKLGMFLSRILHFAAVDITTAVKK